MTDITELAQREKFEAWVMTQICISKSTLEGLRTADGYRNSTLSGTNYNRMWDCWKAAGAELVDALEKAQQNETQASEMAVQLSKRLTAAEKRIAELESRTVTVKLPELCVGVVQDGHAVMVPYPAGHWFNKTAILEMLSDAGIKVEAV